VEETSRLPSQVQRLRVGTIAGKTTRAARQRDRALDERSQFLGLWQRGDDPLFARVDQRSRQVAQHRVAMLACATEFSMCL
jgi:hypothetical protein